MGCSHQIVKTEYVKQQIPETPPEPKYSPVLFNNLCLDEQNAKNLSINILLMKGYIKDLQTVLEGLR